MASLRAMERASPTLSSKRNLPNIFSLATGAFKGGADLPVICPQSVVNQITETAYAKNTKLRFDIQRDFDEVTLIASQPSILAVHPAVSAASVKDLLALAKGHPGKRAFASAGPGSATHLGTELLQHAAGINMLHVPYGSAGQAATALLGGESQVLLTNMASLRFMVRPRRSSTCTLLRK